MEFGISMEFKVPRACAHQSIVNSPGPLRLPATVGPPVPIDKRAAAYANAYAYAYAYYTQRLSQYTIITHKFDNKWLHLHARGHVISQN
jgi:hypothetical protein